jgi:predicted RNA-binding protein YlqC (UPF0109 family)
MKSDSQERIRETLELLLGAMCDHPKDLRVKLVSGKNPIYTITCHANDYGRILGKKAAMLVHLKNLADAMCSHDGMKAEIVLDDATVGTKTLRNQFTENPGWCSDDVDNILQLACPVVFGCKCAVGYDDVSHLMTKVTVQSSKGVPSIETEEAMGAVLKSIGVKQGRQLRFEVL